MSYSIAAVPQVRTYRLAQVYRTVYAYVADSRLYRSTPIRAAQRPWESLFLLRRLLLLLLSSYRFVNLYSSVRVGHWETGFDPRRECQVDLVIRENKGEARPTGFSTLRGPSFGLVSFRFCFRRRVLLSRRPSFCFIESSFCLLRIVENVRVFILRIYAHLYVAAFLLYSYYRFYFLLFSSSFLFRFSVFSRRLKDPFL